MAFPVWEILDLPLAYGNRAFHNILIFLFQKEYDQQQFGGNFNEAFNDLDEYGFTLKRRDTSGDITFRSAESTIRPDEDTVASFSDLNVFGDIKTAHVVETYEPELEISEDKETGEKDVKPAKQQEKQDVYEVNPPPRNNDQPNHRDDRTDTDQNQDRNESKEDVTSDSKTSMDGKYSMDLDELYKDTHLPEKEYPVKTGKKKGKKKDIQHKKKADDVVDMNAESPFVRSFRPSAAVLPPSEEVSLNHMTSENNQSVTSKNQEIDTSRSELAQVHQSNGFVPKERKNSTGNGRVTPNGTLNYNPNNINLDIARLDEDLVPITGTPANQIFQSNVPKLSAHKLAVLGGEYRSSKYKRGNPVERRIIRNSLRESKEIQRIEREEFRKIMHPTGDIVPAWAKTRTEDKSLKYMLIGVLIFLALAAICVPLLWKFSKY